MKLLTPLILLCTLKIYTSSPIGFEDVIIPKNYARYGQALEAIFSITLRLHAIMDTSVNENFVVSPISTTAIIAQLMLGAEGEFREELHNLLSLPASTSSFNVTHFTKERNESQIMPYATFHLQLAILLKHLKIRKPGEHFVLNLDNALFYNEDIDLRTVFTNTLYKIYDTDITPVDFKNDVTSIINKWAANHTNGLIKSFLQNPPSSDTASLFMNSVYFKADWETPFATILNNVDNFSISSTETVKTLYMMENILNINYAETKSFKIVCLPYKNREVGMYIILPNKDSENKYNIRLFMDSMDPKEILRSVLIMKPHDVTIKIPKISLSNTFSLLKPLQKYSAFKKQEAEKNETQSNAIDEIVNRVQNYKNFTAPSYQDLFLESAARNAKLKVSDIVQQMIFAINEQGTEAAAISGGFSDYMGGSKTVVLNRPFGFFIRHEETQAILFWGTISNPSKH